MRLLGVNLLVRATISDPVASVLIHSKVGLRNFPRYMYTLLNAHTPIVNIKVDM